MSKRPKKAREYLFNGIDIESKTKRKLMYVRSNSERKAIYESISPEVKSAMGQNQLNFQKNELVKYLEGELDLYKQKETEFLDKHLQIWGEGFRASEFLYSLVAFFKGKEEEKIKTLSPDETEKNHYRILVLDRMLSRALQQFLEILILNKGGLCEGAYARLRSIMELAICSSFILNDIDSENVAKAYWSQKEGEKDYDWARISEKISEKGRIYLSDLQDDLNIPKRITEKVYKDSSKVIHADPRGTTHRFTSNSVNINILSWRSHEGVAQSAIDSAYYLVKIADNYLKVFKDKRNNFSFADMLSWHQELHAIYGRIYWENFGENLEAE